jgi:hypothetical protein
MSINACANAAAARRLDITPINTVPNSLGEIARAAATPPTTTPEQPSVTDAANSPAQIETALNILFGYIPTEVLTLYVAVLAAINQPSQVTRAEWIAFWAFLVATPIVLWLVYGAKVKAVGKPLPLTFGVLPVWEMFAATVAYCAWAFALPSTPFTEHAWYSSALSGVAVLVASTALGLLAPFFQLSLASAPDSEHRDPPDMSR